MIRNGWWCPDHGFYKQPSLESIKLFIPLWSVIEYGKAETFDNYFWVVDERFYRKVKAFSIRAGTETYLADARDFKEFEDNLPSGLLFNCPKPE